MGTKELIEYCLKTYSEKEAIKRITDYIEVIENNHKKEIKAIHNKYKTIVNTAIENISKRFDPDYIIEIIEGELWGINENKILRQLTCYFLHKYCHNEQTLPLRKIGELSNCGTHSNVLSTIKAVQNHIDTEPEYKNQVDRIESLINKI